MSKPLAQRLLDIGFIRNIGRKVYYEYQKLQDAELTELFSPQRVVRGGIFQGMKYPAYESSGSPLFTKMLGSYEDELNPFLLESRTIKYADIIDIGCAEGYYAVGLAMMHPEARVHAFDIDPVALSRCKAMASANGVSERMVYGTKGEKATLINFKYTGRTLVLCDCEGYEKEIFDEETARALKNADVIIELHDHVVPDIKQRVERAFRDTHIVTYVSSRLKSQKDYPLLADLPVEYKDNKFVSDRNTTMDWAVIRPKG
ncbi:MAG: methyltransferase domain-containing protein [Bacteroidetes bacterium]|nr:methyltransferase domain-containing protein [Bacteroidota bacterium]